MMWLPYFARVAVRADWPKHDAYWQALCFSIACREGIVFG